MLVGARLVDGTDRGPERGRAVVVESGRIAAVVDEARLQNARQRFQAASEASLR